MATEIPPPYPSMGTLPRKIILQIADHLQPPFSLFHDDPEEGAVAEPAYFQEPRSSLHSLCLVSRAFHSLINPLLYGDVALFTWGGDEWTTGLDRALLLRSLLENTALRSLVRRMSLIHIRTSDAESKPELGNQPVVDVLTRIKLKAGRGDESSMLEILRTVGLVPPDMPVLPSVLSRGWLKQHGSKVQAPALHGLLALSSQLESLDIYSTMEGLTIPRGCLMLQSMIAPLAEFLEEATARHAEGTGSRLLPRLSRLTVAHMRFRSFVYKWSLSGEFPRELVEPWLRLPCLDEENMQYWW